MRDSIHTIVFATALGLVCSLLLAAANGFTRPRREANEEAERVRNILTALEAPIDRSTDTQTLLDMFTHDVRQTTLGELAVYEYAPRSSGSDKPVAVAVPFAGAGLWAPVEGILALEPDWETIRGVRFYKQEETPGLGGEIAADWFQDQFKGKKTQSPAGEPGFRIVKPGLPIDDNSVHGITAATMTSERVEKMMDTLIKSLAKERTSRGE